MSSLHYRTPLSLSLITISHKIQSQQPELDQTLSYLIILEKKM